MVSSHTGLRLPIFVGFCLVILTAVPLQARQFRPDFKIGLAASTIRGSTDSDFSTRTGFAGGLGLGFDLGVSPWSIQPEVLYIVKGASATTTLDGIPIEATFDLTYLEVPVLLMRRFDTGGKVHPRVFAGPSLAYKLDAIVRFKAVGGSIEQEETDTTVEDFDFGVVAGAGVEVDVGGQRLNFGLRTTIGLSNARTRQDPPLHNTSVIFFTGLVF